MHSVELLQEAIALAQQLGYRVRQEWVGTGGGICQFRGERWLFIDLSQTVLEQLESVRQALASSPRWKQCSTSPQMRRLLESRSAA